MEPEQLPLTGGTRDLLQTSFANYQRFAGIRMSLDTWLAEARVVFCTAHQVYAVADGSELTFEEIAERAEEVFAPLRTEGILPAIAVLTALDKNPAKPHRVHRKRPGLHNGRSCLLRQAAPRIVIDLGWLQEPNGHYAEAALPDKELELCLLKAKAWWKREPYRR